MRLKLNSDFEQRCRALVEDIGICNAREVTSVRRLEGGVASDIGVISFGDQSVCAKFALHKLNVAEDWYAPLHRGRAEYAWLEVAGDIAPGCTPKLFGWSPKENGFAMEYIHGKNVYLWKDALLHGVPGNGEEANVASALGKIHAATAGPSFKHKHFDNADDFEALRIDPYLRFTGARHPELANRLTSLADTLFKCRIALVHGDISPKNILTNSGKPIMLDAECATMGDPAFDVAFCLNHLVLKSLHLPESKSMLQKAVKQFWTTYKTNVSWEPVSNFEERVSNLLPALMLARVDGKSPVEYLSGEECIRVRTIAIPIIHEPLNMISKFLSHLRSETA
jgi:5-methylthioribose kinase